MIMSFFWVFSYCQNTLEHNLPESLPANSFYTLEVSIKKGDLVSFSKYQLEVPDYVTVTEGNSLDGHFSFEKKRAKIVWVECPKQPVFTFTMRLYIGFLSGEISFEHRFYYVENNLRKEISDDEIRVKITEAKTRELPKEPEKPAQTKTVNIAKAGTVNLQNSSQSTPAGTFTPEPVVQNTVSSSNTVPVTLKEPEKKSEKDNEVLNIEKKEYKVQIASLATRPDMGKYAKAGKVSVYEENGMYKVLSGSFLTKEEALKHMEALKEKGYQGFVVMFINGVKAK